MSRRWKKNIRRGIVFSVVGFVILYVAQIAFYSVCENCDVVAVPVDLNDHIEVSVLLGARPSDKYVPGLGLVRMLDGKPCRVEARYKGRSDYRAVEDEEKIHLDKTSLRLDDEKYYVHVYGLEKPLEISKK